MSIVAQRLGLLDPLRDFVKFVPFFRPPFPLASSEILTKTESNTNPSGAPAPGWSCSPSRHRPRSRAGRSWWAGWM
jgi:hypothetical protein